MEASSEKQASKAWFFESRIEEIIRLSTPDFFVGTSLLITLFRNRRKWSPLVRFIKGNGVLKSTFINGSAQRRHSACPDFILLDKEGMRRYRNALSKAENGLPYENPFMPPKEGWFCEVFGDYWHGEAVQPLSKEQHEKEVREAYEKNGHRVLILWEHDILNNFELVCRPQIEAFIAEFVKTHEMEDPTAVQSHPGAVLSDRALACLGDPEIYRNENPIAQALIANEIATHLAQLPPRMPEMWQVRKDLAAFRDNPTAAFSHRGDKLLDYFVRSRFEARPKNGRSILETWRDLDLMQKCIDHQLKEGNGVHHADRFLNAMLYSQGGAYITNLNQNLLAVRLRKYAVPGGIFYDPCAGWGGRLLAAWKLGMKYCAIDANPRLVEELRRVAAFIGCDAEIIHGDSSDPADVARLLRGRKADLAFTCPPYFDKEDYGDDPHQSMVRHRDDWHGGFLAPMLRLMLDNCAGKAMICIAPPADLRKVAGVDFKAVEFGDVVGNADAFYEVLPTAGSAGTVVCEICGKALSRLGNHLRSVHGIGAAEYQRRFPGAAIISPAASERVARTNHAKATGRKFAKRVAYRLPDGTLVGRRDAYLRAWGLSEIRPADVVDAKAAGYVARRDRGIPGVDFVECKICGERKGNLAQHLRRCHGLSKAAYRERYGGEIYSEKAKAQQHATTVARWATTRARKAALADGLQATLPRE